MAKPVSEILAEKNGHMGARKLEALRLSVMILSSRFSQHKCAASTISCPAR